MRAAAFHAAGEGLFSWASRDELEIHDVGPAMPDAVLSSSLQSRGVVCHGLLDASRVCGLLAESAFGLVVYPVEYVAKSSVFAAYCAHGVCPILISKRYTPTDGLVAGKHYLCDIPYATLSAATARVVGRTARMWYQPHGIAYHAATASRLLSVVGRGVR